MGIYIGIYILIILLLQFDFSYQEKRITVLYWLAFLMIIFIGFRGEAGTDSPNYIDFFNEGTDTVWEWKGLEKGYDEYGFYYLSVILKSIYDNINFYFLAISCITVTFLVKSLKDYCLFPLLGFCIYYARFLCFRDMNQIRQALAIVIVIYALRFLIENRKRYFVLWALFASTFHYSIGVVTPFIWLFRKRLTLKKALLFLAVSGLIGYLGGLLLKIILINIGSIMLLTYVGSDDLGILNPVIYYQSVWCLLFFFYEKKISLVQKGYYVIRNAYLYSTILLLLTCNLGVIGGRLATIFATCEIFVIPSLVYVIRPRLAGYLGLLIVISLFFYLNYLKMVDRMGEWNYELFI